MATEKKKVKANKVISQTDSQWPLVIPKDSLWSGQRLAMALVFIIAVTFMAYFPSLHNGFAWDDDGYVQSDSLIYSLNLKDLFSTYKLGNYHPLTMLVLAVEYHFFGFHATGYHVVNLLIHLVNAVLVFYVIKSLTVASSSQEKGMRTQVALLAALLFAIHPLHVESVAWISELKDLLYAGFFLGSCISYLKYINGGQRKFYAYSLLLFLCSLLSKGMAVALPVVLLLIDFLRERKLTRKIWLEKIPFFILSVIFGVIAVLAQHGYGSIQETNFFSFPQRVVFACYGFITYLFKLLFPFRLSSYYSYPVYSYPLRSDAGIPAWYYIYVLLFLVLLVALWFALLRGKESVKKFNKNSSSVSLRASLFGIGFFASTIFLVLQLLPVGNVIMADRYSYIPSIGIFYLIGEHISPHLHSGKRLWLWRIVLFSFIIFFSIKTYARCSVWKNDLTLWSDVIKQDKTNDIAYYNHGMALKNEKRNDEAISDFTNAIRRKPYFHEAYNNRGNLYREEKRFGEALADYDKSLQLKTDYAEAYFNRGQLMMDMNKDEEAIADFNKSIELKHINSDVYNNLGMLLVSKNMTDEALKDYNKAIELNSDNAQTYYNRGNLRKKLNQFEEAINDYNKAIALQPDFSMAYNNRGLVFMKQKKNVEAIHDFTKAIELQSTSSEAYFNRAITFTNEKNFSQAINDFNQAVTLQPNWAEAYFNKAIVEYNANQKETACKDLQQAALLGFQSASIAYQQYCR